MSDELQIRLRQQALLAELGRRALSNATFDGLLGEAARLCAVGMEVNFCKILEFLPKQDVLLVRAGVGWHEGVVGHQTLGADLGSPAGYALHTGKAVVSNNLATDTRFRTPGILLDHNVRRALNVILLGNGAPWGVLEVDSEVLGTDFSKHDVDFLQAMANLLGMALERLRAEEALRALNETLEERVEKQLAEQRQVEDALRQAQKMEAVGNLTGGIAHDFNNLLQVITGNLDLVAREVASQSRIGASVGNAQKAAERGAQLTARLLAFARRRNLRPEIRFVNQLVDELDVLIGRMLGDAIVVECNTSPDAGACLLDPALFSSALLNLLVNARDAMPERGRLTVTAGTVILDARTAARHADARAAEYVFTQVTDTGHRMPEEVVRRATEPFFTTKVSGKGTGLGLAQVHGFAHQSGGFLTIVSAPGSGTTIRIHLPRVFEGDATVDQTTEPETQDGPISILVVEDDATGLDLLSAQLEELGFSVLKAKSGPEALEVFASHATTRVDLLITDLAMPGGMSGYELVHEARLRHPKLRPILISGHATGGILKGEVQDVPMLSKPYHLAELERTVRAALAAG